jgi:sugar lactone lactonase YvrE
MLYTPWNVRAAHRGLDHSVGLNFGPDGRLYAGGELGQVYAMERGSEQPRELARTGGFVGGLVTDADNNIYACDSAKRAVLKISQGGGIETYCNRANGRPLVLPNYNLFDDVGNLYFTDSGPQSGYADYWRATGRLIRVSPGREATELLGGLRFPSGIALSEDGRHIFLVESSASDVLRVPIEGDGSLGACEVYVQLPDTVPEGIAIGRDGNVYVSCYRPDQILRIDRDTRAVELLIRDDTSEILNRVTNIAFPPDGSPTLYFANMGAWHIGALEVGAAGLRLRYPALAGSSGRAGTKSR